MPVAPCTRITIIREKWQRLPPLHALLKSRHPLPRLRLPEHIEMLMPNQVKIILLPEPFLPGALHLPLQLDDILAHALIRYFSHLLCELGDAVHA